MPPTSEPLLPPGLLDRALRTADQGLLITDAAQTIVFANAAITALTGYDEVELLGRNCRMLQGKDSDSEVLALMRLCLADGEPFRGKILNFRKDGTPFWNALSISPVCDDDGVITHFISTQRDITAHVTGPDRRFFRSPSQARKVPSETSPRAPNYREKLLEGGLRMHMQPVVDLRSGTTHFVEALARLELEDGTLISPEAFLPLLTESDLALLFRQALEQVLRQVAEWDGGGLRLMTSINLEPSTLFDPDCVRWVATALKRHGIEPPRLRIELLETGLLYDTVQLETFAELNALGVSLTMDDLGSGHSGFRRLLKLPFDAVKVDGGIVAQVRNRPVPTLAVLTTLIQMGRDHGWEIIIEGLEDAALTEVATILGARYGQGFFICPPIAAPNILAWSSQTRDPMDTGTVHTVLGALAYHWLFHRTRSPHTTTYQICPITRLLVEEDDRQAIEWHRQQHLTAPAGFKSSGELLAWLVERSRREATPMVPFAST